ncbi:MAG: glycosyltransferase family 4 protein [Pseudomonadales bacterium]|nr:glycosyltransferase family 4 protein [Pseudomonadales bacterium]
MNKLLIVTTVPCTLDRILIGQPKFLNGFFTVVLVSSSGVDKSAEREGVPSFVVEMHRGISPLKDLLSIYRLVKVIFYEKPDVIHSFTPKAGLVSAIAGFLCRVPVRVHTFTGLIFPSLNGVKKTAVKMMDKLIVALNTHIVPEGQGVWNQLIDDGFDDAKFEIIGNGNIAGVDLNYFCSEYSTNINSEKFSQRVSKEESTCFLFVGRLNKDKGIKELVKAFLLLKDDSVLLLAGDIDEARPPEKEILDEVTLHANIFSLGHVDDVRTVMSVADCLILPSYREGFPNVVLQAGAMSLPAIVTDISGCNEIITQGENGWLVEPKNILALKDAMENFKAYEEVEIQTIKRAAKKNVHQKYDRTYYQQEILEYYRNKLNENIC